MVQLGGGPNGRVEDCPFRFAVSLSPAPASSNGANGFAVRRFAVRFASRVMRPIDWERTGVTPLPRYYGPVLHPLVFGRLPGCAGYTAYLTPPLSRRDEEGFSSCSTCPGHRAVAPTPLEESASPASLRRTLLPSPRIRGLGTAR